MMQQHALPGRLAWIGLRPSRREALHHVQTAEVRDDGLIGDHSRAGKRAVTLIQQEHLSVIANFIGIEQIDPARLRRNLVVSGLNLYALRKAHLQIGEAVLHVEGPCPPCSRMEEEFGPGGYNAIRGHGGWYASVVIPGKIATGDAVSPVSAD